MNAIRTRCVNYPRFLLCLFCSLFLIYLSLPPFLTLRLLKFFCFYFRYGGNHGRIFQRQFHGFLRHNTGLGGRPVRRRMLSHHHHQTSLAQVSVARISCLAIFHCDHRERERKSVPDVIGMDAVLGCLSIRLVNFIFLLLTDWLRWWIISVYKNQVGKMTWWWRRRIKKNAVGVRWGGGRAGGE